MSTDERAEALRLAEQAGFHPIGNWEAHTNFINVPDAFAKLIRLARQSDQRWCGCKVEPTIVSGVYAITLCSKHFPTADAIQSEVRG